MMSAKPTRMRTSRPSRFERRPAGNAKPTRQEQRGSKPSEQAGAPEGRLPVVLDELDAELDVGNVSGARQIARNHPRLRSWLDALANENITRMRAAAVIAETHFAYGEDAEARTLLEPYAVSQQSFLGSTLAVRHKLQLAEYFYSLFKPDIARFVATEILESATDPCDIAECCYYLSRFCLRQLKMQNLSNHFCLRGLEALQSLALSEARSQKTKSEARL